MFEYIKRAFTKTPKQSATVLKRSFDGAKTNPMLGHVEETSSIYEDIRQQGERLRGRARALSVNNSYCRRAIEIWKSSIVGSGFITTVQAYNPNGEIDPLSEYMSNQFADFLDDADVTGMYDGTKLLELVIETLARDGEFLALIHRGQGKHGLKIQALDIEWLDMRHNGINQRTGNRILSSVECDSFGAPVAYWLTSPSTEPSAGYSVSRTRYEAKDVIHLFDPDRCFQVRGYSWFSPVITSLHQLNKFTDASLMSARLAATKAFVYEQDSGTSNPDSIDALGEQDDDGYIPMAVSPGESQVLPKGITMKPVEFDPRTDSVEAFTKIKLREIAAGLNVSYHILANDLESVNYSSARFGALVDNNLVRSIQSLLIRKITKRLYEEWLDVQLLKNTFGIPVQKRQKFLNIRVTPPKIASIDPAKDAQADQIEFEMGLTSLSELAEKRGKNFASIVKQRKQDSELLKDSEPLETV